MYIQLFPPIALWEKGRRQKNEDNIYPSQAMANASNTTFLVCDGVGGASKGELASQIVANTFGRTFDHQVADEQSLHETLAIVQEKMDNYIAANEQHKGMGTTFTFLQFNESGAIIAHAGDSRVYHIRNEKILFRTYDHSLVNDLLKLGKREEAKLANTNIITRAIQGTSVKKISLDVHVTTDIQIGDYFLLCTDGVWSVLPDEKLIAILNDSRSNNEKVHLIDQLCSDYSRDNYSAYLIQIADASTQKPTENTIPFVSNPHEKSTTEFAKTVLIKEVKTAGSYPLTLIFILVAIFLLTFVILYFLF